MQPDRPCPVEEEEATGGQRQSDLDGRRCKTGRAEQSRSIAEFRIEPDARMVGRDEAHRILGTDKRHVHFAVDLRLSFYKGADGGLGRLLSRCDGRHQES